MPRRTDISSILIIGAGPIPSPRRGEGGARSASGEGARRFRRRGAPSPRRSPRWGEGDLRAPVERDQQFLTNGFEHAFGVRQHVVVPETDDAVTERFDDGGARCIDGVSMLSAVQFNREMRIAAGEVGDVGADRKLSDKFGAIELAGAKVPPQAFFRFGLIAPQFARDGSQAFFRHRRSPSPQPSPRRGEGVKWTAR